MSSSCPNSEKSVDLMAHSKATLSAIERDTALRNAVIDAALDCIVMIDEQGLVVEFNPAAEKTFGYTRTEAIGRDMSDLLVPDDLKSAHRAGMKRYLATGEARVLGKRIEVPSHNKAGDRLLVELAINPVEFDGQKLFAAYLRDITSAKAAEEKLRASEERFQSLFQLSADAIVIMGADGTILEANQAASDQLKCEQGQLVGQPIAKFCPEDQKHKALQALRDVSQAGTVRIEMDFLDSFGERISTEVVGNIIQTADGPIYHGVARDISARVATEQNLRDSKEAAEKANRAKTDFLANMSHEMRTPLNGIIGSLSLLDETALNGGNAKFVKAAERSAETLLTLIDDLLDLSRIEAGEIDLEFSELDAHDLAVHVEDLFKVRARDKGVTLDTQIDVRSKNIFTDVGKIRQVLLNLVGNALKFTPRGRIDVRAVEQEETLMFEVKDTGIGIAPADQAVLFDRFKQVDSSHRKLHGGAGLGLAICRELVELMGGKISVESNLGEGATFRFHVPVKHLSDQHKLESEHNRPYQPVSGRVLIAEDSQTNAMVAIEMLKKLGLEYVHVTDGAAAVDAALSDSFDAVLMDVSMPHLDGMSATRMLRARGFKEPIIAMTAHALKEDRKQAFESGMSGYVTKPMRPADLRSELGKWLAMRPDGQIASVANAQALNVTGGLDKPAIDELWAGDLGTYAKIAKIFLEELDWRLPGLSDACASELEHHAHSLKGAAANIGATRLNALTAELETLSCQGGGQGVEALIEQIKAEAGIVREELLQVYIKEDADG